MAATNKGLATRLDFSGAVKKTVSSPAVKEDTELKAVEISVEKEEPKKEEEKTKRAVSEKKEEKKETTQEKRGPGRPSKGALRKITLQVPAALFEKAETAAIITHRGNMTSYINSLISKDIEENSAEYDRVGKLLRK